MNFDPLSFAIGNHGDFGPVRDVVSYLIGQGAGTAGEIWRTITNVPVASFTAVSVTLRDLMIDVTPVQSGNGDPSPLNVRPISGWDGANIVVSPTLFAEDGTTYPVSWQSEAGTVYGGTLTDNGDGTLALLVTHVMRDLGSFTTMIYSSSGQHFALVKSQIVPAGRTGTTNKLLCSVFKQVQTAATTGEMYETTNQYRFIDSEYTTVAAFQAAYSGQQFVYPLATPRTYTLTAESVLALIGQNNVFADTGNINTITFRTH